MDLRSGFPYWAVKDGLVGVYPALEDDYTCDIVVIGAGITGALIAHALGAAGRPCTVLDGREVGWGSTMASTALLQHEIDVGLNDLSRMISPEDAAEAYIRCRDAVGRLGEIARSLDDPCDFQETSSLFLAKRRSHLAAMRDEAVARKRLGIDARFLDSGELRDRYGLRSAGAILSADAAKVDPYRLTHALLRAAAAKDSRIFDRTRVGKIERRTDSEFRIETDRGHTVTARHVIVATGYEAQSILTQRIVKLKSTYALATEPLENAPVWLRDHVVWESGTPYFYLRSTPDKRLLLGGADDEFRDPARRDRSVKRKAERVHRYFRKLLPDLDFECAFAWAGTFGETKDGLAYFGMPDEMPGVLFALGFGGNGITFGVQLAEMAVAHIDGRIHPGAHLFRFDR